MMAGEGMDAAESTLVAGYRLDRYELLCPIASGGMASVWLARLRGKRGFEKLFAIKTIKTELIAEVRFQEMFLDEARIASRIIHPNVAQILELGEQEDILYIVMEWVEGDSLAQVNRLALKRGTQLPLGIAMRLIADVCAGLHAAHQLKDSDGESLGVVHRDVSPQNILLTTEGSAKVIDFGLVKAKNRTTGPTDSGVVKGKIRYMAPEQVGGMTVDHRADIWAVGMCLYELVVGHVPYDDEDDLDVIKRLMSPYPLPPLASALPAPIQEILAGAIVADPAGRFETCARMRRAIEAAIHELGLEATNDDVADFLRETLPELATKRAKTVAKAFEAADARAHEVSGISARERSSDVVLPLTRKSREPSSDGRESDVGSRPSGVKSLKEQLGERQKRGGLAMWFAALVVVGVGAAWLLWPRATDTKIAAPSSSAPSSNASSSPPSVAPSSSVPVIELDEPGAAARRTMPGSAGRHPIASAVPVPIAVPSGQRVVAPANASTGAPSASAPSAPVTAPTYNPAWSILTNPPEAGLRPPPSAPPPPAAPTVDQ